MTISKKILLLILLPIVLLAFSPGDYVKLYKENYLAYSYDSLQSSNDKTNQYYNFDPEDQELNFQISLRADLFRFYDKIFAVTFGYTQKAMWQIFASSGPMREMNFNPELFIETTDIFSKNFRYKFSLAHKSNGQADDRGQSRSMNYIYFTFYYTLGNFSIFPTIRAIDGDTSDFTQKVSWFYIEASYMINGSGIYLKYSPAYVAEQKYNIEVSYSYSILKNFALYFQYYNGYNETEIDYDKKVNRISVGLSLNKAHR